MVIKDFFQEAVESFKIKTGIPLGVKLTCISINSVDYNGIEILLKDGMTRQIIKLDRVHFTLDNLLSLNQGKHIRVEHTSPNPVSEIHTGRYRGTFLGQYISNFLRLVGFSSSQEVFLNDISRRVAAGLLGYRKEKAFNLSKKYYKDEYMGQVDSILDSLSQGQDRRELDIFVDHWVSVFDKSFEEFNMKPSYVKESDFCFSERFLKFCQKVIENPLTIQEGESYYFYTGVEKRCLINKRGATYFLKDVYYSFFYNPENPLLVQVIGKDHEIYSQELVDFCQRYFGEEVCSNSQRIHFGFVLSSDGSKISSSKDTDLDFYEVLGSLPLDGLSPQLKSFFYKMLYLIKDVRSDFKIGIFSELSFIKKFITLLGKVKELPQKEFDHSTEILFESQITLLIYKQLEKFNPASFFTRFLDLSNRVMKEMVKAQTCSKFIMVWIMFFIRVLFNNHDKNIPILH